VPLPPPPSSPSNYPGRGWMVPCEGGRNAAWEWERGPRTWASHEGEGGREKGCVLKNDPKVLVHYPIADRHTPFPPLPPWPSHNVPGNRRAQHHTPLLHPSPSPPAAKGGPQLERYATTGADLSERSGRLASPLAPPPTFVVPICRWGLHSCMPCPASASSCGTKHIEGKETHQRGSMGPSKVALCLSR
jgi:hypothetical protein